MNIKNYQGSLLSDTVRVSAPFIKVDIGGYSFGVYEEKQRELGTNGLWKNVSAKYPNYIQSLNIKKINGTVNTYTLRISYPITKDTDPNFFEKVFSNVSGNRKITFTYGDSMLPEDVYANESALITNITQNFNIGSAKVDYEITAIGDTAVSLASQHTWKAVRDQPSRVIASLISKKEYKLQEIFYGMQARDPYEFIDSDDQIVTIPAVTNKSIMDYISTLVSYMVPNGMSKESVVQNNIYTLATYDDYNGVYGGPYFEVRKIRTDSPELESLCSYNIDIGYPTANVIEDFSIKTNNNWSIFYDYNRTASSSDYVKRLNSKGELEYIYNPQLTDGQFDLEESDKTWWTKVTEFPIEASIRIRGLLRPAILMNYVHINVWFYGHKHLTSGYYLITGETDDIGMNGYHTTLDLIRVAGEGTIVSSSTNSFMSQAATFGIAGVGGLQSDITGSGRSLPQSTTSSRSVNYGKNNKNRTGSVWGGKTSDTTEYQYFKDIRTNNKL